MPAEMGNNYAAGNPGGGAPPGNDNACGNDGGAPLNNANAAKHGGWADPLKHYERLKSERPPSAFKSVVGDFWGGDHKDAFEEIEAHVDELVENYALVHGVDEAGVRSDESLMDDLRRLAAMLDLELLSSTYELDKPTVETEVERDGVTYTTKTVNPAWRSSIRLSQRQRNLRAELGIELGKVTAARERQQQWEEFRVNIDHVDVDFEADKDSPETDTDTDTDSDTDATESADTPADTPDTDPDPQTEPDTETTENVEGPVSSPDSEDTEIESDSDDDGPGRGVRSF